jgi:hypothetical protein
LIDHGSSLMVVEVTGARVVTVVDVLTVVVVPVVAVVDGSADVVVVSSLADVQDARRRATPRPRARSNVRVIRRLRVRHMQRL